MTYRVEYPKTQWARGEAWDHLHAQQIPGCPKVWLLLAEVWAHGWRKAHTATSWVWEYREARQ